MLRPYHSNGFFIPGYPIFLSSVEGEARVFEPHYVALPAFAVGVLLGVLFCADRVR
jgi:hypothetical protein